jgi:hypothetical protein
MESPENFSGGETTNHYSSGGAKRGGMEQCGETKKARLWAVLFELKIKLA